MAEPIIVTATDPETGETSRQEVAPGGYAIVCVDPLYLDGKQVYGNGTVVLTLKRRPAGERGDAAHPTANPAVTSHGLAVDQATEARHA